jgi:hypothetical protein
MEARFKVIVYFFNERHDFFPLFIDEAVMLVRFYMISFRGSEIKSIRVEKVNQ